MEPIERINEFSPDWSLLWFSLFLTLDFSFRTCWACHCLVDQHCGCLKLSPTMVSVRMMVTLQGPVLHPGCRKRGADGEVHLRYRMVIKLQGILSLLCLKGKFPNWQGFVCDCGHLISNLSGKTVKPILLGSGRGSGQSFGSWKGDGSYWCLWSRSH